MPDAAILERILAELVGLRADLAVRRSAATVAADSHADLVRAIGETSKGLAFTVSELLLHAEVVATRAADPRLHAAIVAAVGAINGRRLGKMLCRIEGEDLRGLRIIRVSTGRDGIVWRVAGLRV